MEEYPGLLNWANSVRQNMANDPGRQLFKDQVQTHGFSFLDDYLDSIMSGQNPLIDLVKTPGPKKAALRNPKLMALRFGLDSPGEHIQQIETFSQTNKDSHIKKLTKVSEVPASQLVNDRNHLMTDIQEEVMEMSQKLMDKPEMLSSEPPLQQNSDILLENKGSSPSTMNTLHSTPLDLPDEHTHQIETFSQTSEVLPVENHNEVPMAPILQLLNERDHVLTNIQEEVAEMSPKLIHKPNPPSFPTLPEPMPLRKSMKPPRDPSMTAVLLGAATPGAPVGGKRTSWLMKAREAKALDGLSKKSHPSGTGSGIGASLQGTKRKSDPFSLPQAGTRDDERPPKLAKTSESEIFSYDSKDHSSMKTPGPVNMAVTSNTESQNQPPMTVQSIQEGVFDRLKKTVEGLGVRVGKPANKSIASDTATVLAEARAAAKAKVAERDRKDEELTMALPVPETTEHKKVVMQELETPLNISDLFPAEGRVKEKHKVPEKPFMPNIASTTLPVVTTRTSTSTTPPHSPPPKSQSFAIPHGPVFHKLPPVFVPHPTSPPKHVPLTAHSTLESIGSDAVFDHDDVPAWMPSTQDTEYTTYDSQSQPQNQMLDEDDSWPLDEKLAAGVQWRLGISEEDNMTWSTMPSQSQRADNDPVTRTLPIQDVSIREEVIIKETVRRPEQTPVTFDVNMEDDRDLHAVLDTDDTELQELVMSAPKLAGPVENTIARSQSQMSMASSDSSQSQGGFFGHASKLLSSTLGTSKKGKQPEVKKVLQMAAVAAKKQQEEADKKVARLKEMESRRQLAIQRKVEEEKAKVQEEERKRKEEAERRKREREEHTDKRPLKIAGNKKEDETLKKRKVEVEKKQEIKKPSSSILIGKAHLKSTLKPSSATNPSHVYGSSSQSVASTSTAPPDTSFSNYKVKTQNPIADEISQPSMLVQSQMAARVKARIDAAKRVEPVVPSENIELPEINSEYSDSEDEDRVRTFDPPEWAQSPELRQALEMQSTMNPDDIFGTVRPLKMEEIFKSRTSRFRARTSSANWTGTDQLTMQEESEYARRMGFK